MTVTATPARLWSRRYAAWFVNDTATEIAGGLAAFAIPLLALMITDDPARAGVLGAVGIAVRIVAALVGGVLADRHSRPLLMAAGGALGIVVTIGFTALEAAQAMTYFALFVVNVALALRVGLFDAATQATLKDSVPDAALGRAQAATQGRDAVLSLASGPLGGALLAIGGWLLGITMLLAQLLATASALVLRRGEPTARSERAPRSGWAEMAEAARWLLSRRDLRGTILVTTLVNLGANAVMTTVVYSLQQSGSSPAVIGFVSAGVGVGMLVGAIAAPLLIDRVAAGTLSVVALFLLCAALGALPVIEDPVLIAVVVGAGMACAPALNAALLGYYMVATPSELMGRASSLMQVFGTGAMPFAPLVAGLGLAWFGRTPTLLFGVGVCVVSAVLALCTRSLRAIPRARDWAGHALAHSR